MKDDHDNEDEESPIIDEDEHEGSFWENLEKEKPEQTEIQEQTHYYRVGPFIVNIRVDRTGDPVRTRCNCDSTSRIQDRHLIYLFDLKEPIEVGKEDRDLYYCIHEYAAVSRFWKGLYDELKDGGVIAEEIN